MIVTIFELEKFIRKSYPAIEAGYTRPNSFINTKNSRSEYLKPVKDVDEYITLAPKEVQDKLKEIRTTIKTAAPNAQECISYGIPYYYYKGRLVYFGLSKNLLDFTYPLQS